MGQIISVGLFEDSVAEPTFSEINELVIRIMEAGNVQVTSLGFPEDVNSERDMTGEFDLALELAMENIRVFEEHDFDYIVNTIGGPGTSLKEYDKLFVPGTVWYKRAKHFTERVRDISEIMKMAQLEFKHEVGRTAVYQSPDQLSDMVKVFDEPVKILKQIPGLDYIETKHEESRAKPDLVITSHPVLRTRIRTDLNLDGKNEPIEVKHIVEVVAESCGIASNQ
ncbi:MAG TPA: (Fe-S)-binding protein [Candidatus Salinicoccus stercoripullorum]|uniref:(Fe-S)-binding protein n=1 Tax=Candidatus Salinicoccus stercoripullorum TaxID=2838756 RepID=A0A9D1QJT0_9STAP|nr:(Fe-S)-binding protein [Candidatus Salinicoccus stercoripullorum]